MDALRQHPAHDDFDFESFDELHTLRDGTSVQIRPLRGSDREAMRVALERLSPESRYQRFMSHKIAFSDREVEHLANADGVDHVAVCAVLERPGEPAEIIGTAQYFQLGDPDVTAEPAFMVLDAYQGTGLGSLLFGRLLEMAAERGVRWFECQLLASNVAMRRLIDKASPRAVTHAEDEPGTVIARFPVRSTRPVRHDSGVVPAMGARSGGSDPATPRLALVR